MFKNIITAVFIFYTASGCGEQSSTESFNTPDSLKMQDSMIAAPVDTIKQSKSNDTLSENKLFPGSDTLVAGNYQANGHTTNSKI